MSAQTDDYGDECSVLLAGDREWRRLAVEDFDRLDAEWESFVSGGKLSDRIVEVAYAGGGVLRFLISEVLGMDRNTREDRRRMREIAIALDAERKADGILD